MSDDEFYRQGEQQENWGDFQEDPQSYQQYREEEDLLSAYQSAINSLAPLTATQKLTQQKLKHHRIVLATRSYADFKSHDYSQKSQPILLKALHYGYHCVYKVTLGIFCLQINILNVHRSSDDQDVSIKQDQLGSGGFGTVRSAKIGNQLFAIKRINFIKRREEKDQFDIEVQSAEKEQIKRAIQQYAMYKICSMLGVGPQIIFRDNYDLICYNNCLQFLMELCIVPSKCRQLPLDMLASDLLSSLKTLHAFHFVHRDIKPDNILYSQAYGRFVMVDFGLTHPIAQEYYQSSQTFFAGTLEFLSSEMLEISEKGYGKVNLYLNDYHSLRLTIDKLQKLGKKSFSYQGNSMSFQASIGDILDYEEQNPKNNSAVSTISTSQSLPKSYSNIFQKFLHSLDAPSRSASQINFYQSHILFEAFRIIQHDLQISKQKLQALIRSNIQEIEDQFVKNLVARYVKCVFFPIDEEKAKLCLLLSYLKNAARHFGPKSLEVNTCIKQIIEEIDSHSDSPQALLYFTQLRQTLQVNIYFRYQENQQYLTALMHLRKYDLLIDYLLKFLIVNAYILEKKQLWKPVNYRLLSCLYVICLSSQIISDTQAFLVNDYFSRIFDKRDALKEKRLKNQENSKKSNKQQILKQQTLHLMKLAVKNLVQREYYHLVIYIKAFYFYLESFIQPNIADINFYMDILAKIERKSRPAQLKSVEIICNKFYMIQLYCKFYMHFQNHESKIKELVAQIQILDGQSKLYYFLSLNRLTAFYLNTNQNCQAYQLCQLIMKELAGIKYTNELEKLSIYADLYKLYGVYHLQQNNMQLCLEYLNKAKEQIMKIKAPQNFIKDIYEINRNIALCYYQNKCYKQALNTYQRIIMELQLSKKDMVKQKAFVYRSVLVIYIQTEAVLQQAAQVVSTIKKIVKYTVLTLQSYDQKASVSRTKCSQKIFNFFNIAKDKKTQIFLMETLRKSIHQYLQIFQQADEWLNRNLFHLYYTYVKIPDKAMQCLSRYTVSLLNTKKVFTVENVQNMNFYAQRLINFKLSHKACLFLKKYVFAIAPQFQIQRQTAFWLYNRALKMEQNQWHIVTDQLVKNDYSLLSSYQYQQLKLKRHFSRNTKWKKLLQKWLKKLSNNVEASSETIIQEV